MGSSHVFLDTGECHNMESSDKRVTQLLMEELVDIREKQVDAVLALLEEGNTVPFIARYRKEATGSLDEVQIKDIEDRYMYIQQLEKRKNDVLATIQEQEKLTPELEKKILEASKMQQVEDLYRPYKQKRRTKATMAKEKGLEPLAHWILTYPQTSLSEKAESFLSKETGVLSVEDALAGAHEILAERIGDTPIYREWIRTYTDRTALLETKEKDQDKDPKKIFQMYYEYAEPIRTLPAHRILAINRGEKEGILSVTLSVDEENILRYMERHEYQTETNKDSEAVLFVQEAIKDAYKRFIGPSIEREIRTKLTEHAEEQAIAVFGENLGNLLLQPPLKNQVILGFDPAYRTGCKLAVIDGTGKVLDIGVIFPHPPASAKAREAAGPQLKKMIETHHVDTIAIGNGTASRESESFVASVTKELDRSVHYVIVNEAGASVYSASEEARREFPDFQVEERSAVSIARRLQDPLAELVKIDPKSIGVGQYQHDVSQKKLSEQLDFIVETVVNQVGVNINTASASLLRHISGLTKTTAENVVTYREAEGEFTSRAQLKKVPRLGPKAFEQSVGFLRILGGKNPLDATSIHPESYLETKKILTSLNRTLEDVGTKELSEELETTSISELEEITGLGTETLKDILHALKAPGRDLRDDRPAPLLRSDVLKMEDLTPGLVMEGTVRNVVDFGAFVDIGVKQDGLVHLSQLSDKYIAHPREVVSTGDIVTVRILSVDLEKDRIGLTMKLDDKK